MPLEAGHTYTLGAQLRDGGVNFCLAAPNAQAVDLCLFDEGATHEVQRLAMYGPVDGIWHGFLPGAQVGLVYGWRVHGPWEPAQGQRFNPAKLLLDPCAREVLGRYDGDDIHLGHVPGEPLRADTRDNAATALKARVVQDLPPVSGRVRVDAARRVIYEVHLKGFTAMHPQIPDELRGTYAGMAHPAAIAHVKALGVTSVCLMPVAQRADEVRLLRMGLSNYWGYSPIAWNAPEQRYWSGAAGTSPRSEMRALVDALHAAGLEVILDVVYNHTAETDELGPTLSLRGIDNQTYYHLAPGNPGLYANWTGCGNCVNLNEPLVLRTVMDSLRGWVQEFGVDGFRFDLAPVLARAGVEQQNRFEPQAPFLLAVAQDPVLRHCTMVAEPWDIGPGGYQLGGFPPGWLEWNDRFRDTQRSAWLQHHATRADLAHRLAGSAESFAPARRAAQSSVNLVTAHDGFTLMDLVSYTQRHNEANGENNRDGHGHNLSVNNGVEGPTGDSEVLARRLRQRRVLLASLLWSLGTPMLLAGDEFGQSQGGNNNAYCQDNATTWLDWARADRGLMDFVAHAIALRVELPLLQSRAWWRGMDAMGSARGPISQWWGPQGQTLVHTDWHHPQDNALVLQLSSGALDPQPSAACLLLLNPRPHTLEFVLPAPPAGGPWLQRLETDSGNTIPHALGARLWLPGQSLLLASATAL